MAAGAVEQEYRYLKPSRYATESGSPLLYLATSSERQSGSYFFHGFLERPKHNAVMMLQVARVARTRFFTPAAMTASIIKAADPVVTSDGSRLRFESFSADGGVYSRYDMIPDASSGTFIASGTTNVDFNLPIRDALSNLDDDDPVHLSVGLDEVALATMQGTAVEKRIPLPLRWIRGFGEVQVAQSAMQLLYEMPRIAARRFLSVLARTPGKGQFWAAPDSSGLSLQRQGARGGIPIGGLERLRPLSELARYALGIRVHGYPAALRAEASAWEVLLEDGAFHLVISPEASRGFSGEGGQLFDLLDAKTAEFGSLLHSSFDHSAAPTVEDLASRTHLGEREVGLGLAYLAGIGVLGYDISARRYFLRELPYRARSLEDLYPRLKGANELAGAVTVRKRAADLTTAWVRSGKNDYEVNLGQGGWSCSCRWFTDHLGQRGPCKHVLAVRTKLKDE